MLLRFYRTPAMNRSTARRIITTASHRFQRTFASLQTEFCFYVDLSTALNSEEAATLRWLLAETFDPRSFSCNSFLAGCETVLEVGPRLTFETPFSSNAVDICHKCGLTKVRRLERSIRYGLDEHLSSLEGDLWLEGLHDRLTQERYYQPRENWLISVSVEPVRTFPLIEEGIIALRQANQELGLAMDDQDLNLWSDLFVRVLGRNPTDLELFQIGQANSEHSRHGWFKGCQIIDGQRLSESAMDIVRSTWLANPAGSVIAFADNSSAIFGHRSNRLVVAVQTPRVYRVEPGVRLHPTLTAETHNHPTGVEPFDGSGTGVGGRLRDGQAVGRGGEPGVGGAGYCTADLCIPGYKLPWENDTALRPAHLATPLEIMLRASDGASFYGNCFGEPLIYGFTRTFEQRHAVERRAWYKPIMYSVGAGTLRDGHQKKSKPEPGMLIVLLGGPGFRIGVGGGSASSMIAGTNAAELDFASVQRGNPEMKNRMDRVIRACVSLGKDNPIESVHDLGAGGACNALPEIADPAGARISLRAIPVADQTLSGREIWGNESQERNVILIRAERLSELQAICERENCPWAAVGEITGDGQLIVYDDLDQSQPVALPLENILGKLPRKVFEPERIATQLSPLIFPAGLSVRAALERVLRLVAVASKRWLINKVDRSVTGLVAQQQCVGPSHLPLSDYAIRADSYFGLTGAVLSLGEQPMKGLIDPAAMARLAVAEALLNMSGAVIDDLRQVKCSGNWMWAAKLAGEGPRLIEAAQAARDIMIELGIAIDGGKDSLSMAVETSSASGESEIVKAPGQFVVATYASTADITQHVTPDLKKPGDELLWIDLGFGRARLGGSALAQVFDQLGDQPPDVDDVSALKQTFQAIQDLVRHHLIEAIHDISDGGLIVTLLEMAFAGQTGLKIDLKHDGESLAVLLAEEPGLVIEVSPQKLPQVLKLLAGLPVERIGRVGDLAGDIEVIYNGSVVIQEPLTTLRAIWEETSDHLERRQVNPDCAEEQEEQQKFVIWPPYKLTFSPQAGVDRQRDFRPAVALIREEGTNGDREMAAALLMAGFETWDVNMHDLIRREVTLDKFRGVVFPGGFSFGDVLDSGKGWAGVIRFNPRVAEQFEQFRLRSDTFSLGVCNGCQLMALLGWVPGYEIAEAGQPRFIRNQSERFESRFSTVRIEPSSAIMLRGMVGSVLGVWVAHGEGRLYVPNQSLLEHILASDQTPIRYVDSSGEPTIQYPHNPNGSPAGVAALCSIDGRHLAMMPHPERTILPWQWPWLPQEWRQLKVSPWFQVFINAYDWCRE